MHYAPLTDLYRNHISFSVAGQSHSVAEVFNGFDVDMPTTDRAAHLRDLHDQVAEFARPYRHQTTDSLAAEFRDATPDKWEKLLNDHAIEQVKAQIVRDIFPAWRTELRDQIKAAEKDADTYAEYIAALPLAETIDTMTTAAKALRGTHHDAGRALDVDPVTYAEFRDAGRKLARLNRFINFGGLTYDPGRNPELLVALYANPADLPELTASATKRGGVYEPHFTDDDRATHDQVVEARELIRGRRYNDLFLAELAAGRWPALKFTVAATIPELKRRANIIAAAGAVNHA